MGDLLPIRYIGWLRTTQPGGRFTSWRPILIRDAEADAWNDLYQFQRYDHPRRDLCVLREGRKP